MKLFNIVTDGIGLPNPEERTPAEEPQEDSYKGPKDVFMAWQETANPNVSSINPKFLRTGVIIGAVLALLLASMGEFFLILLLASIIFFVYAIKTAAPQVLSYELSNYGVQINETLYKWDRLVEFFFPAKGAKNVLVITTRERFPGRLYIFHKPEDREKIKQFFEQKMPYLENEPMDAIDKMYYTVADKFNFEKDNEQK